LRAAGCVAFDRWTSLQEVRSRPACGSSRRSPLVVDLARVPELGRVGSAAAVAIGLDHRYDDIGFRFVRPGP
jgi:hypothetical protein